MKNKIIVILIFILIKDNLWANKQYENTIKQTYSLLDYGAVGDGTKDDSQAFIRALESIDKTLTKKLIIPDGYFFNLSNKNFDLTKYSKGIILEFQGGIIMNATLKGNQTKIKAERIKLFDNINLSGSFSSLSDYAYPEWMGIFPNDNTIDLADGIKKLSPVFFDISLGTGDYYTRKGEIPVNGLKGVSMAGTRVIMETDKSNTYLFSLGKIGGTVKERTYNYNYIRDVNLFITTKTNTTKLKGNRGIIVGAVHKPLLENVRIQQSFGYQMFVKSDLYDFLKNENKVQDANVGIDFHGDSEVSKLSNIFTIADIGIMFSQYTDFVNITDFMNWCGPFGLANVYFKKEAVQSQNLLFTGSQSWNQGLYGLYSEDSNLWNSFRNNKFENLRIEQLTADITQNGKVVSTSIRIGKSNLIANLMFENIILSGASNGIYIGETTSGNLYFDNVVLYPDTAIKREFAIKSKFLKPSTSPYETPFKIHLKNVDLYNDTESYFENSDLKQSRSSLPSKDNRFTEAVISYQ
ncbi:hypothetical protein [Chryseobacterium sp. PMSZPI]|uniref:hypothetical protein n=1 Tax=Chryseobacterium sp. PMSZPI TaxID=1033900 RepID=UPI0010569DFB|nr:hypothetical protein [Chryseobacterium sp. PMSZPI]